MPGWQKENILLKRKQKGKMKDLRSSSFTSPKGEGWPNAPHIPETPLPTDCTHGKSCTDGHVGAFLSILPQDGSWLVEPTMRTDTQATPRPCSLVHMVLLKGATPPHKLRFAGSSQWVTLRPS